MYIEKILSNGIRVVAEHVPYAASVSIGVWVGNGSRHEKKQENGISHFIEHMVFKGTKAKTAKDIALIMDSVGGQLNAFTTKECTCFYARTLNDYAATAADVLSDMVFEPKLDAKDMELERRVINEEIAMYEDSPEDVVYDLFSYLVWGDTPMGRTILGTSETLADITPETMREYMRRHYTSKNIAIAVSGRFDDSLFELLEKHFGTRNISGGDVEYEPVKYRPGRACVQREFEQVQLVVGFNGIDILDDEAVYPLLVFNNIFGSSMSSRLFQNIREKYGLAYSITAGHSAYLGTGTFDISAATAPEHVEKLSQLMMYEINRIKTDKLTDDEIERAKIQLKGNYLLSYENIGMRMQTIGRTMLLGKQIKTPEENIEKIMAVDSAAVSEIIDRVTDMSTLSVAAAGPIDSIDDLFL